MQITKHMVVILISHHDSAPQNVIVIVVVVAVGWVVEAIVKALVGSGGIRYRKLMSVAS